MKKPLGHKAYGHIPHFPGSRIGPGDHKCSKGQYNIATKKTRDKYDTVIVQEKLDGSNVAVAKVDGNIIPLTRAGYRAETSPFEQHHHFASWVLNPKQYERFHRLLIPGERVCGEWLLQAHGTRYNLPHEPLVIFDIITRHERLSYYEFMARVMEARITHQLNFTTPNTIWEGTSISIEKSMKLLGIGLHGAIDKPEGVVYRIERYVQKDKHMKGNRKMIVDYLAKYVRPDKKDGIYLPEISGKNPVYNTFKEIL